MAGHMPVSYTHLDVYKRQAEDKNDGVGRFDIADYLTRMGKGHCWVRADSGLAPGYGDIFRVYAPSPDQNGVATNHMGVALYFNDGSFYTCLLYTSRCV